MQNLFLLSLCACTLAVLPAGQSPKLVKGAPLDTKYLRDYAETRGFMLGRPVKATPTPDGKAVLFLRGQPRVPKLRLYEFDVASRKTRELLTPEQVLKGAEEQLSPEEKARRERMRVSVGGFTGFHISEDSRLILLSLSGKLYTVDRKTETVRELPTGSGTILDPKFSPDGKSVSYVRDHDVCVLDLQTQEEHAVTTGGSELLTHGLAEFVAQEEMNRFSGYWWSPDSKQIAYQEADAKGVEVWYVADPANPGQKPQPQFYPRPGKANVKVRLGVVPVAGGKTVWIDWDRAKYPYLASVRWPKNGPLLLQVQTRDQTELLLLRADLGTGQTKVLVRETDPAWVNIDQDVPRWLADGSGFLWMSESGRDGGGPRLELLSPEGELVRVVVPSRLGYRGLVDVDAKTKQIVVNASVDPTQSQLWRVQMETLQTQALTKESGLHSAAFSKDHSIYVHSARLQDAMPRTTVHRADGALIGELPSVAESPPIQPGVEYLQVGPEGGFYAAVVRPRNFEPRKRYPVIVDVYGGPHHLHVVKAENRWLLDQWLADQGFIVVAIDNRGTPGRGRDWERAIKGKFASVPLEDQVTALKALGARYAEMDLKRVGIDGWSFGGYMAALAVLKQPEVYKAAVAGAPVVDWLDYDTHYTERYLGVPPHDEDAYKENSLLTYAAQSQRPLLLLHGTADDNVYFRHSLRLVNALFREGKHVEILPLPSLTHMVPDPVVMERLYSGIATFFQKHLGRPMEN